MGVGVGVWQVVDHTERDKVRPLKIRFCLTEIASDVICTLVEVEFVLFRISVLC